MQHVAGKSALYGCRSEVAKRTNRNPAIQSFWGCIMGFTDKKARALSLYYCCNDVGFIVWRHAQNVEQI
jgi:hypothetical protein